MRPIKFRAFLNSKYYEKPCMLSWEELLGQYDAIDMFQRDMMTLMQYTGLKDVNGREIYEGDIVQVYRDWIDVVEFQNGSFGLAASMNHSFISFNNLNGEAEVMGNIYTNPELLEAKD